MSSSLFKEGGPRRIKNLGNDRYSMSVTIPRVEEVPEVLAAVLAAVSRVHAKLIKERYG